MRSTGASSGSPPLRAVHEPAYATRPWVSRWTSGCASSTRARCQKASASGSAPGGGSAGRLPLLRHALEDVVRPLRHPRGVAVDAHAERRQELLQGVGGARRDGGRRVDGEADAVAVAVACVGVVHGRLRRFTAPTTVPASMRMPGTGSRRREDRLLVDARGLAREVQAALAVRPAAAPGRHHRHPAAPVVARAGDRGADRLAERVAVGHRRRGRRRSAARASATARVACSAPSAGRNRPGGPA